MSDFEMLGPYELRGELGRGAMARVWRAYDPKLEREVAIKEPLFDEKLSEDVLQEMAERFVKEAKAAARLNHPGIVAIYAADVYDKRPAIVMELVDGITLGDMLENGAIGPAATLEILDQLLDAAGYAHSQGVVHRDIKPDNIFITSDGRIKLGDFGIAHVEDSSLTKKTQIGTVLGTPGYMAPEQAVGTAIDNRTDLFSIGTIAYEMLSGFNPFGVGETTDSTTLLYRIVHEPPPELPELVSTGLPADIRPAILAALNKNPDDRPQNAAAFKSMLHGAPTPLPGTSPASYPRAATAPATATATAYSNAAASGQKKWLPYILIGALGVVVIVVLLVFAIGGGNGGGYSSSIPQNRTAEVASSPEEQAKPVVEDPQGIQIDIAPINAAISSVTGSNNVAVGIIDLDTGKTFFTDNKDAQFEASGFYLPLVNAASNAGIGGGEISSVLSGMSNDAANSLINALGGFSELNNKLSAAGLKNTSYNRYFGDTGTSAQNLSSAADAIESLKTVYHSGNYKLMQADLPSIGIYAPAGTNVNAHRGTGVKTAVNVFTVITRPNAKYAVAVLSTGLGNSAGAAQANAAPMITNILSIIDRQVESSASK